MAKTKKAKRTRALNTQQKLFCAQYLKDFNATQAALRAGYSPASAHQIGCELLKNPQIKRFIAEHVNQVLRDADVQTSRLLEELYAIALSDITDFFFREEPFEDIDHDTGEETIRGRQVLRMRLKEDLGEKTRAIQSIEETSLGRGQVKTKYKLYDKLKAIELIAKIEGLAKPDKVALTNPDGTAVTFYLPQNGRDTGKN
jgi:phage terminase small subunit